MPDNDLNPQQEDNSPESGDSKKKSSSQNKPEKNGNNNLFWYLMLGVILAFFLYTISSQQEAGEKVKYSEFKKFIENDKLGPNEVHELTFGPYYIRYQDQPKDKDSSSSSESAKKTKYYSIPIVGIQDQDITDLRSLLEQKGITHGGSEPPSEWRQLMILFLLPMLVIIFIILVFRKLGGPGAAISFGRSRGKLYAQEDIGVTFNDAAGIDEAVHELREVVEFLKSPEKYHALGGRIPRGVLLVGPPGTGKTLLAKAVAGEAGVPFFSLSGSDFVEMFVGVGAARVRDMFHQAGQRSPSIIFIDELDALGKVRGSGMPGGHDEREQTLNALLVEMDGFSSDQSVIVMAATNRPETLDPALLRPGRFDRHVLVDRPDIRGREAILKVHAAKIKMDSEVDLHRVAKLTPGFVGADLANLVNEAALLAARADKKRVTADEFEEGIDRVVAGLEKQTRILHEDEKQRVAYHECGHALVATSLPHVDPVHKISMIPRGMGALGYMMQRPEDDRHLHTQTELQNRIAVLLGGIAAEEIIYKETSSGAQNDLQRATDIARRMVMEFGMSPKLGRVHYSESRTSPFLGNGQATAESYHSEDTVREIDLEVKRLVDEASRTAHDVLNTRRAILEDMTRELMECEVMDAELLKVILDRHKTSPQITPGTHAVGGGSPENPASTPSAEEPPLRESSDGA